MKKIIVLITSIMLAPALCSCMKIDNNIDNYADDIKDYEASSFMPTLDDIGQYEEIEYFSRKDNTIFPEYSMQLVVKYDEENFFKEKERLKTAYTYLDEPQKPEWDNAVYTIPIEEFSIAGFDFKIAVFEDTDYPKNFGMVGVSDEKSEIAYLWIYASDLDYICKANEDKNKEMIEFFECHFSLE